MTTTTTTTPDPITTTHARGRDVIAYVARRIDADADDHDRRADDHDAWHDTVALGHATPDPYDACRGDAPCVTSTVLRGRADVWRGRAHMARTAMRDLAHPDESCRPHEPMPR